MSAAGVENSQTNWSALDEAATFLDSWDVDAPWVDAAYEAVTAILESREARWCLFHWSTAKSSPEYDYCRIAEWSGQPEKVKVWCRIVDARICLPVSDGGEDRP